MKLEDSVRERSDSDSVDEGSVMETLRLLLWVRDVTNVTLPERDADTDTDSDADTDTDADADVDADAVLERDCASTRN